MSATIDQDPPPLPARVSLVGVLENTSIHVTRFDLLDQVFEMSPPRLFPIEGRGADELRHPAPTPDDADAGDAENAEAPPGTDRSRFDRAIAENWDLWLISSVGGGVRRSASGEEEVVRTLHVNYVTPALANWVAENPAHRVEIHAGLTPI